MGYVIYTKIFNCQLKTKGKIKGKYHKETKISLILAMEYSIKVSLNNPCPWKIQSETWGPT